MADSNAERQRRKRAHAAGDHSLCTPGRCPAAADRPRPLVIASPVGELDPRHELEALARRLVAVTVADPLNTGAAKALVDVLRALPPRPGELDPLERAQARVAGYLAAEALGNVSPIRGGDNGHER
jgi:hypothetical protein